MSAETDRETLEADIQAHHDAGELEAAASVALRGYGPEILGYLTAVHDDAEIAGEVFQRFSEDVWRGLEDFEWRSSFRTWAYVLARNASHRYLRDPHRKRRRRLATDELDNVVAEVRDSTLLHKRTTMKDAVRELRRKLNPDDRTLLVLRIDREMAWRDVARVMLGDEDGEPDKKALRRESARLRKRFERVKDKLRELAIEAGLLS